MNFYYYIILLFSIFLLIICLFFLYNGGNIYELLSLSNFSNVYNKIDNDVNQFFIDNKNTPVLLFVGNNIIYKEISDIRINSLLNKIYINSIDYSTILDLDKDSNNLNLVLFFFKNLIKK